MDSKNYASSLSEAKVIADLTQKMYHIFTQSSGKAPFDLVAFKDKVLRIQVKACYKPTTKQGRYKVQLGTIHTSMKQNIRVKFDANKCDILAIYLIDCDKILYFSPSQFHNMSATNVSINDPRATQI